MQRSRRPLLGMVLVSMLHQGCFGSGGFGGCDAGSFSLFGGDAGCLFLCGPLFVETCPKPAVLPAGPIHGTRADGRVDVTAAQAWPERPPPETPPTAQEVADACAAFA